MVHRLAMFGVVLVLLNTGSLLQAANEAPRVITVSPTGQMPYKNPGILTLGTLTIQSRIDFGVTATSATSSGSKGGALTYSWDWGDGSPPGSGAQPNHTYVVPGTYTVTVTIVEAGNATPSVLTLPVTVTDAIKSVKLQTNENWSSTGQDSLTLSGVLRVPYGNGDFTGQTLNFDIGGAQFNFTLRGSTTTITSNSNVVLISVPSSTSNGNVVQTTVSVTSVATSTSTLQFFLRKRPVGTPFVDAPFTLRVTHAYFSPALADEFITDRNAVRENVRITVKATFNGVLYQSGINQLFSSIQGKRGKTR